MTDQKSLRDIFGNIFRPAVIDPCWLAAPDVDLVSAIYNERAYDRMPILADARINAGCDHDEIVAHCRGEGPHVRGCRVVDLLLRKARTFLAHIAPPMISSNQHSQPINEEETVCLP